MPTPPSMTGAPRQPLDPILSVSLYSSLLNHAIPFKSTPTPSLGPKQSLPIALPKLGRPLVPPQGSMLGPSLSLKLKLMWPWNRPWSIEGDSSSNTDYFPVTTYKFWPLKNSQLNSLECFWHGQMPGSHSQTPDS